MIILLMGVSGSGKTTIGRLLSDQTSLPFYDADDFHPSQNVEKMKNGIPLDDDDRKPWLETLAAEMALWEENGGAILACSALKEQYRKVLAANGALIYWFFLKGSADLISQRMAQREGHYMPASLLTSQMNTLEVPRYAEIISIEQQPEKIANDIMSKLENTKAVSSFGIIGMGVMGSSLALNMADKNIKISIYNRTLEGVEEDVAKKLVDAHPEVEGILPFDNLERFVESIAQPRKILMMIPAGAVIDQQIARLLSFVDKGDVIIDGGNSFFEDSNKRMQYLQNQNIHFLGMGISGGREGALQGPSLMPGGSKEGYELARPYLEKIAGVDTSGKPCLHYIGPQGAGHFVKMVHNSIEYGEIQVLAEIYSLMRFGIGMSSDKIVERMKIWAKDGADSYLLNATIEILSQKEGGELLLDQVQDIAGQTGTGRWAVSTAAKHGVPYAPLTAAVTARMISTHKQRRTYLAHKLPRQIGEVQVEEIIESLQEAYSMSRWVIHEIGFSLIKKVSEDEKWDLNMSAIARGWTNGSIIKSSLMEGLAEVFTESDSLFTSNAFQARLQHGAGELANVIGQGLKAGIAMPVMSAAINYYYAVSTEDSTANLVQSLRDYFGEHGCLKVGDDTGTKHLNFFRKD